MRLTERNGGVWSAPSHRDDLISQALSALHLYILDKHYIVEEGQVRIVDEYTGRIMPDRSWERGLHQMVEAKEGLEISGRQETLARISYQRFFRRYLRLSGMTGTAKEVAGELWSVYRLDVVRIPTNRPSARQQHADQQGNQTPHQNCPNQRFCAARKIHARRPPAPSVSGPAEPAATVSAAAGRMTMPEIVDVLAIQNSA